MIAAALLFALQVGATPRVGPDTVRDACTDTVRTARTMEQCLDQQEDSAEDRLNHTVEIVLRSLSPALRENLIRASRLSDDYRGPAHLSETSSKAVGERIETILVQHFGVQQLHQTP